MAGGVNRTRGALVGLFLCGTALRPQIVGVSPLFPDLERSLDLSHTVTGLLTALPLVCMGAFALAGVPLTRTVGSRTAVTLSLLLLATAGTLRAFVDGAVALVLLTAGVGIGTAVAGAVVPQVVKETFEGHPVRATATYATGIQVGATISAVAAIPLAAAFGGWQASLAAFGAFTFVVVAAWVALAPRVKALVPTPAIAPRQLAGVGMLAATFAFFGAGYYGLITWLPEIYVRQGWSAFAAGALLSVLNVGAMAGGFAVAYFAGVRRPSHRLVLALSILFAVGITGFVLLPQASFMWAIVAGATNGALLPLVLALPLELSSDPISVARASAIMLGFGYTFVAVVPVFLGGVRDLTGSFATSEVMLAVIGWGLVAAVIVMFHNSRPRL